MSVKACGRYGAFRTTWPNEMTRTELIGLMRTFMQRTLPGTYTVLRGEDLEREFHSLMHSERLPPESA